MSAGEPYPYPFVGGELDRVLEENEWTHAWCCWCWPQKKRASFVFKGDSICEDCMNDNMRKLVELGEK